MDKTKKDLMIESIDRQIKELNEDLKIDDNFKTNEVQDKITYVKFAVNIEEEV